MIKNLLSILLLMAVPRVTLAQVTLETNLPAKLPVKNEHTFDIRVLKGQNTNYSRYQLSVPEGIVIRESNSHNGTFLFEKNLVTITWPITPAESVFDFHLTIVSSIAGPVKLQHSYHYLRNNERVELALAPLEVEFAEQVEIDTPGFRPVKPKPSTALTDTVVKVASVKTRDPEELQMQVLQLKKDSRDAYEVGKLEKQKAQDRIRSAEEAISIAENMKNDKERKQAIELAKQEKTKAELDVQVASKILILAKTLEENAREIEKALRVALAADSAGVGNKDSLQVARSSKRAVSQSVYRIQLGAFSKQVAAEKFSKFGTVSVVNEDGVYKVLMGKYATKEEALASRERFVKNGLDCFVVHYNNGVRQK